VSSRRSTKSHELTFEDRSRGGKARAEKIRLRKLAAEDLRIQMLAEGPARRRRRPRRGGYFDRFAGPGPWRDPGWEGTPAEALTPKPPPAPAPRKTPTGCRCDHCGIYLPTMQELNRHQMSDHLIF